MDVKMDPKQLMCKIMKNLEDNPVILSNIPALKNRSEVQPEFNRKTKICLLVFGFYVVFHYVLEFRILSRKCILSMPDEMSKAFRPPTDCEFCRNVDYFDVVSGISPSEFEGKYAYSGRPVKVSDGADNWTATQVFDYEFFKQIYDDFQWRNGEFDCQFFAYKSGFLDIYDAFNMTQERVEQSPGTTPWYFGWSNCNYEISKILREHYKKPYFLPITSENNAIDWIFMGVPGKGAHLHVDNVRLPSWQAQLKGTKEWILAPPLECYYECKFFKIVVKPGEIIVLDTNRWFHQTNVLPGEVSVTIGAEYD